MLIGSLESYILQEPPNVLDLHYPYARLPEPNVEIGHEEFLEALSPEVPSAVGFETIVIPDSPGKWEMHYWFFSGTMIAMAAQYAKSSYVKKGMFISDGSASECGIWFRFFRCGCQHEYMVWTQVEGIAGSINKGVCPGCGYSIEESS
jgi:hypothetical protein